MFICLFVYSAMILLIQKTPQWKDVRLDAITYDLQGRAIAKYLKNEPVPEKDYGLVVNDGDVWTRNSTQSMAYTLGSVHTLYQMYIGLIYYVSEPNPQVVIISHASMLAVLPLLCFLISFNYFSNINISLITSMLVLFDSNFIVNSIWLLKDTLATLLLTMSFLILLKVIECKERINFSLVGNGVGLTILLHLLSSARFHASIAFWIIIFIIAILKFYRKENSGGVYLLVIMLVSFYASGLVKLPINNFSNLQTYKEAMYGNIISSGGSIKAVINNATSSTEKIPNSSSDSAVSSFYMRLKSSPGKALTEVVTRTLFAPYPWGIVTDGYKGRATELYWIGTILWVLNLPFILIGLIKFCKKSSFEQMAPFFISLLVICAYLITYGEFSTRQRQFLVPIFWVWAAYGITITSLWLRKRNFSNYFRRSRYSSP